MTTGAESRMNFLADSLSRKGVEVDVFARKKVDRMEICQEVRFHECPWLEELQLGSISIRPLSSVVTACLKNLGRMLDSDSYDLVQAEGASVAPYGMATAKINRVPWILDEPDAEFEKARQTHHFGSWRQILFAERIFSRRAAHVLTSSSVEKGMMTKFFGLSDSRISVIPNGVDTSRFSSSSYGKDLRNQLGLGDRPTVLFMGNFRYFPNLDGLNLIVKDLVPRVSETFPDVLFLIIGRELPNLSQTTGKNFMPLGFVDDPRKYIEMADVCIAPIRYGGGTRIKILEYMAMGKAVVSTSKGAEGLEVTQERDIMIQDDLGNFAQTIIKLLRDNDSADKMGKEAMKTAKRLYDWSKIAEYLISTYQRILEG